MSNIATMVFEPHNDETDCPMGEATDHLPTSPSLDTLSSKKEKRQSSVTPRKFTRFFTPRSHRSFVASSFRGALNDIMAPVRYRNGIQSCPLTPVNGLLGQENVHVAFPRDMKRRKLLHTPSSSPDESSPEKSCKFSRLFDIHIEDLEEYSNIQTSACQPNSEECYKEGHMQVRPKTYPLVQRIQQLEARGLAGRLVQLSLGCNGRSIQQQCSRRLGG